MSDVESEEQRRCSSNNSCCSQCPLGNDEGFFCIILSCEMQPITDEEDHASHVLLCV